MTYDYSSGPAGFVCECNILYAGNGTACGIDTDGDSYPDNSQNCQGPTCIADNCAFYPNTDQVLPRTQGNLLVFTLILIIYTFLMYPRKSFSVYFNTDLLNLFNVSKEMFWWLLY